ncbi:MAG: hypothetical protein ACFB4I_17550 [Cyanophyceae cyanobacterium]
MALLTHIVKSLTTRSTVVLLLLLGSLYLAVTDTSFRPLFSDLAKVGLGGYLGQLRPESKER